MSSRNRLFTFCFGLVLAGVGGLSATLAGELHWPQFRGPLGNGVAEVHSAPESWGVDRNIAWKRDLPGRGWSSPVVADGLIWLTTAVEEVPTDEEREQLLAKSGTAAKDFKSRQIARKITLKAVAVEWKTGEMVHEIDLFQVEEPDAIHALNSYASPTPVIDGDSLYCHFGTFGTACINRNDGKVVWRRVLPLEHSVGPGSSPFVEGNLVILICDGCDRQYVAALNKQTGETVWEKDRPEMDAPDGDRKKSFDTPIAVTDEAGRRQVICMGSQWIVAYDPSTGDEIWKLNHGKGFSVVPRPVVGDGIVYFSTGFGKPELWGVRINGSGDVTNTHVVWKEPKSIPAMPSPLYSEGRLYVIDDKGVATCFRAADGTVLWKERVAGNYSSSPLLADGKIYFCSHEGVTTVIADSAEFHRIAENQLPGQIMASPVALGESLLIRTDSALYRVVGSVAAPVDAKTP